MEDETCKLRQESNPRFPTQGYILFCPTIPMYLYQVRKSSYCTIPVNHNPQTPCSSYLRITFSCTANLLPNLSAGISRGVSDPADSRLFSLIMSALPWFLQIPKSHEKSLCMASLSVFLFSVPTHCI